MNNREAALEGWYGLTLEEQFYKVIEYNDWIAGDNTRHPNTLTGREIESLYGVQPFIKIENK